MVLRVGMGLPSGLLGVGDMGQVLEQIPHEGVEYLRCARGDLEVRAKLLRGRKRLTEFLGRNL